MNYRPTGKIQNYKTIYRENIEGNFYNFLKHNTKITSNKRTN